MADTFNNVFQNILNNMNKSINDSFVDIVNRAKDKQQEKANEQVASEQYTPVSQISSGMSTAANKAKEAGSNLFNKTSNDELFNGELFNEENNNPSGNESENSGSFIEGYTFDPNDPYAGIRGALYDQGFGEYANNRYEGTKDNIANNIFGIEPAMENGIKNALDKIESPTGTAGEEESLLTGNPDISLGEAYKQFFANNSDLDSKYGGNIARLSMEAEDLDTWRRILEDPNLKQFYQEDYRDYAGGRDTFTDDELQAWYDNFKPTDANSISGSGELSRNYGWTDNMVQDAFLNYLINGAGTLDYYPGDNYVLTNGSPEFSNQDKYNFLKYENTYNMFKDFLDKGEAEKWSDVISDDDLASMLALDPLYFSRNSDGGLIDLMSLDKDMNAGQSNVELSQNAIDTYGVPFVGMADTVKALAKNSGKDYFYANKNDLAQTESE